MATFTDPGKLATFADYKPLLKTALGRLKEGTDTKFAYFDKHKFAEKERPMLLVDAAANVVASLPKPFGAGECTVGSDGKVAFTLKTGAVKYGGLARLFADVGAAREVMLPGDSGEPVGEKLNMRYGLTEWRKWGAEASSLVEKFDELLTAFKELPAVRPEWVDLQGRHVDLKLAMAGIVKTEITNTPEARVAHQVRVEELLAQTVALGDKIRKRASTPVQPDKPSATTRPSTPQPSVTPVPLQPPPQDDPQARQLREAQAQQRQKEQQQRAQAVAQAADVALETLRAERDGYAALALTVKGVKGKQTAKSSAQARKDADTLERSLAPLITKALTTSGYRNFAPAAASFDAFEKTLQSDLAGAGVEPRELTQLQERLDTLARARNDLEQRAVELDPAVIERRATGGKVRGWIWTGEYDYAKVKSTLKDIVGIVGRERSGRTSPNGKANHVHIGGDAQYNVLFHQDGEAIRVLGFVTGHMDKRMSPTVRNEADVIEKRASRGEADFTEVEVDLTARTMVKVEDLV